MNKSLSLLLLSFLFVSTACNNKAIVITERPNTTEWQSLFSGENLDRWIDVNASEDTWHVRDQMTICSGPPIGVMRSEKQYENFIMEVAWRHMEAGGNSGVFIWSEGTPFKDDRLEKGIDVQMLDLEYATINNRTEDYVHGELFPTMDLTAISDNPRGIRSKSI